MKGAPDRFCRIAIIGGGAIGTSIAYHLANAGENDVLLIEKSQITHGCTWHAAGLVGQLRGKRNLTRMMQNSVAVFDRLEAESDQTVDWKKVGSLRLASSPDRCFLKSRKRPAGDLPTREQWNLFKGRWK